MEIFNNDSSNLTDPHYDTSEPLHWVDYVVISLVLLITLFVGFLFRFLDRKRKSQDHFLFAGREMSFFPVAISLFMSGAQNTAVLVNPVEVYTYGLVYWSSCIGATIAVPIVAHVFAELYHLMGLSTTFQFLEFRFKPFLKPVCSFLYGVITLFYAAASLHETGRAMSHVAAAPVWLGILVIGVVALSCTSLGGLRAVVWVHVLHFIIALGSLGALTGVALLNSDGFASIWEFNMEAGRINIFTNLDPNPLQRSSLWIYLFGSFFWFLTTYSYEQFAVQRYSALKSACHVIGAVYCLIPFILVFTSLYAFLGLLMVVHFTNCDPIEQGIIQHSSQLLPLMGRDILAPYAGLTGLLVAGISCLSLSYFASSQVSLATTWLHDIAKPLYKRQTSVDLTETQANSLAKVLALAVGVATVSASFALHLFTLLPLPVLIKHIFSMVKLLLWPVVGLYITGVIFRFVNYTCALLGALCCAVISILFAIGAIAFPPAFSSTLPQQVCLNESSVNNNTQYYFPNETLESNGTFSEFSFGDIFSISPILYPSIGPIVSVIFSLLFASFYCCCCKEEDTDGIEDASIEFDTEGFHVDAPPSYLNRQGYNYKEVPSFNEDNLSQISGKLPRECVPMTITTGSSHA